MFPLQCCPSAAVPSFACILHSAARPSPAAPHTALCMLSSLRSFHTAAPCAARTHSGLRSGKAAAPVVPRMQQWRVVQRAVHAAAAPAAGLLRGVAPENREDVVRILEQAERALSDWSTVTTDFYTPPVVADAMAVLQQMADVSALPWGGYAQAERCRLLLGREELLAGTQAAQCGSVALLTVRGNFMFDPANHRDFLGACLGTGIERSKVGDILVQGESGAQILVAPQLVQHLELSLLKVRSVPVETREAPLSELKVREPKIEEMRSVEASMRLDAVASAGFRMSRSKISDLVKAGDVRVNWRAVTKGSVELKAGDVVSCAGKGRLEVREVGETKKGKYAVEMVRYL